MPRRSDIRELFGIEHPLIQAPMAGAQASAMAIAVAGAGALGSLPCAMLALDGIAKELEAICSATDRPINVNFFCHAAPAPDADREMAWRERLSPYYAEFGIDISKVPAGPGRAPFGAQAADVVADFRPRVVSFHFGLPSRDLLARVKGWGSKVISSATTVEEARWLERQGVDAVIAQGNEAGGHRAMFLTDDLTTQAGTFALLPQVVNAVRLPVIAAGGIADAGGVRAAFALGASGVQVGTAFLLCPEATTSAFHRAALKSEAARHTALTNVFTGRPSRTIVNRIVRELGPMSDAPPAFPFAIAAIAPLRAEAERRGSGDFSALLAGQNASGCREVPAAEIIRGLVG